MQFHWWARRLALGIAIAATILACRTTDVLSTASQPTPTRVAARATFTPAPTATSTPTVKPTLRPTLRPTARPPTAKPQPTAPPPPAATVPPFRYKAVNIKCVHSGQSFIQGTVYEGSSPVNGKTVVMSFALDGPIADSKESGSDGDGFYSMIVSAFGAVPGQTRFVWIVEGGRRVSDAARFDFNNIKNPDDPASCWHGVADFQLWAQVR